MHTPEWDKIEDEVVLKLHLLRAVWEHTDCTDLHEAMARDIYIPALSVLARFCACVEEVDE